MERETLIFSDIGDKKVDFLFWLGCAGRYDQNVKTDVFINLLKKADISFAILGKEEKCTGDVARRIGNEYLFQMMALQNIETFKKYNVKNILTICPHCFNTFKNEYGELGGNYNVIFYTEFILKLIKEGKIDINKEKIKGKKITFHDPCYLGRGNGDYNTVRELIKMSGGEYIEMKRSKSNSFCCGAGGGQIFKESEKGKKEVNKDRAEEIEKTNSDILTTSCPFCNIMLRENIEKIEVLDILDVLV